MAKTIEVIKIESMEDRIWHIKVKMPKYLESPIIKYMPLNKTSDDWYASIFIEEKDGKDKQDNSDN